MSEQTLIISIFGAIFASTGFWAFLTYLIQRKDSKKNAVTAMLIGLGHDRICCLGACYINQGFITRDDYENLHDYLYVPYKKLGGNGTAGKIMNDVNDLPLKEKEGKSYVNSYEGKRQYNRENA